MNNTQETIKIFELTDELLEIIYNADDFTTSDLQGVIGAWVKKNCKLK